MLKIPLTTLLLNDDETASDGSKTPWWQFSASLRTDPVLRPTNSDFDKVVSGLHMLEILLPGPLSPLLPPGSTHLHGEILMGNRKKRGRIKGTAWMNTGKLEMMTALLMRDGRYDDAVAIVPFALVNAIGKAFEANKRQLWSSNLKTPIWKIGRDSLMPYSWKIIMPARILCCLQSLM